MIDAIMPTIEPLLSDSAPVVRVAVFDEFDWPFETLRQGLGDPHERVRQVALRAIARFPGEAIPLVTRVLRDDADEQVRMTAAGTLYQIEDAAVIEPLLHALEDPFSGVRATAAQALAQVTRRAARRDRPRVIEALTRLERDEDEVVRDSAARAIKEVAS